MGAVLSVGSIVAWGCSGSDGAAPAGDPSPVAEAGVREAGDAESAEGSPPGVEAGVAEGGADGGVAYDLNDVSFLFPLPTADLGDDLLSFASAGAKGPLLPKTVYDALGLQVGTLTPSDPYLTMRAIGVRVDPCGPVPADAGPCTMQVRLVFQPMDASPIVVDDAGPPTVDAAVHLTYAVTGADATTLRGRLAGLKQMAGARTNGKPLGVHPVMREEGLKGAYATAVRQMVLEVAGAQTLVRATGMGVLAGDLQWPFGGVNVLDDGGTERMTIPRIAQTQQPVQLLLGGGVMELTIGLDPGVDKATLLLRPADVKTAAIADVNDAVRSTLTTDHPSGPTLFTIDCASCHVAARSRERATSLRGIDVSGWPERFTDDAFDLTRTEEQPDDMHVLRAFGYFGRHASITQRTVNESAVAAKALRSAQGK